MKNISKTTLGNLIEFQRGFDLPKSKFIHGEYPVQSSNSILGYHNEFKVKGPGITIGRSGTVGIPHLLKSNFYPHNTSLFIKNFKGNNISYIFYLLKYLKLGDKKSGSSVPTMNRNHLHPLNIIAHLDVKNQSQIAKVLSDLDAKIELNNKINAELEAMAKLIYDYWFVQFDFPDANGKPYKSSGGKMVYSEELKREIPEGWGVKFIKSIIEVKDGTHDSPKSKSNGYHLITSKNLKVSGLDFKNANFISEEDYTNINKRSKVETGDILFSMIGSIGVIYKVEETKINFAIKNVALYKTSQKSNYKNYIYQYLKSYDMQRYMGNVISGSIQKFIGLNTLREMPILINDNLIQRFETKTINMFLKLDNIKKENQSLTKLRDWLLPMLMNGQVRVE